MVWRGCQPANFYFGFGNKRANSAKLWPSQPLRSRHRDVAHALPPKETLETFSSSRKLDESRGSKCGEHSLAWQDHFATVHNNADERHVKVRQTGSGKASATFPQASFAFRRELVYSARHSYPRI